MADEAYAGLVDFINLEFPCMTKMLVDPTFPLGGDGDESWSTRMRPRKDDLNDFFCALMLAALFRHLIAIGVASCGIEVDRIGQ